MPAATLTAGRAGGSERNLGLARDMHVVLVRKIDNIDGVGHSSYEYKVFARSDRS